MTWPNPGAIWPNLTMLALALFVLSLPWVWRSGGKDQRTNARIVTLLLALDLALPLLGPVLGHDRQFMPRHAAIDLLILLLMLRIALRTNRFSPLVLTAAALIAVTTHGLRYLGLLVGHFSYLALVQGSTYVMILSLWAGPLYRVLRSRPTGRLPRSPA
jgi:hypothetical protein